MSKSFAVSVELSRSSSKDMSVVREDEFLCDIDRASVISLILSRSSSQSVSNQRTVQKTVTIKYV